MKKVTSASEIDIDTFARDIVDSWDVRTLIQFAVETIAENMSVTPQQQLVEEYNEFYSGCDDCENCCNDCGDDQDIN